MQITDTASSSLHIQSLAVSGCLALLMPFTHSFLTQRQWKGDGKGVPVINFNTLKMQGSKMANK